ncbi:hypothetical protein AAII07_16145 [Microvirga sp. 0TCS3.31]
MGDVLHRVGLLPGVCSVPAGALLGACRGWLGCGAEAASSYGVVRATG